MTTLDQATSAGAPRHASFRPTGTCLVPMRGGQASVVYRRRGRWAISWQGVSSAAADRELVLSSYLDVLRAQRLRPLFVGLTDPTPYARRGFYTHPYADEAVLELTGLALGAASLTESRCDGQADGLLVLPYRPVPAVAGACIAPIAELSALGAEAWMAVDSSGAVRGVAAWDSAPADAATSTGYPARVLRLLWVHPKAPTSCVGLLIADAVAEYRGRGMGALHVGWRPRAPWWPVPGGPAASGLRLAVERFDLRWRTRWLAMLSAWELPAAACALRPGRGADHAAG